MKRYLVHRLVAMAFVPNPNNYNRINHKDENKSNNDYRNLEWCTDKYNANYGTRNARSKNNRDWKKIGIEHSRKVFQYTIDGKFVKEYPSVAIAAEENNFDKSNIRYCCIGHTLHGKRHTAYGYKWAYEEG